MSRLDDIKQRRADGSDVDWLVGEVERLTAAEQRIRKICDRAQTVNDKRGVLSLMVLESKLRAALDGDGVQE